MSSAGSHLKTSKPLGAWTHHRKYHPIGNVVGLRIAPMVDMSFLFLIFFLATARFERQEGHFSSKFPRATGPSAEDVALPLTPIVIRLTTRGTDGCAIRIDRVESTFDDADSLTGALLGLLAQPGFDGETPVVIVAEDEVRWDHLVGCWNAAIRAGYSRIAFADPPAASP